MKSSVFAGFHNTNPRVLVVQRRDEKGSWYLPGGEFPEDCTTMKEGINALLMNQLGVRRSSYHFGYWMLSPQAGGGAVHLQLGELTADMQKMALMDWSGNPHIQKVKIFGIHEIRWHLYAGLMPWGQAKMALVSLCTREYLSKRDNLRPDGQLLQGDLGMLGGYEWTRPKRAA